MSTKRNTKTTVKKTTTKTDKVEEVVDEFADVYPENMEFNGSKVMRYKKVLINGNELYEVFTFDGLSRHVNKIEEIK